MQLYSIFINSSPTSTTTSLEDIIDIDYPLNEEISVRVHSFIQPYEYEYDDVNDTVLFIGLI
jgi:hypothetical protein